MHPLNPCKPPRPMHQVCIKGREGPFGHGDTVCIEESYPTCDGYLHIVDYPLAPESDADTIPEVTSTIYDITPEDRFSPFDATCDDAIINGTQQMFGPAAVSNFSAVVNALPPGPVRRALNSNAPSITLFVVCREVFINGVATIPNIIVAR